jgi:hypothetical protein
MSFSFDLVISLFIGAIFILCFILLCKIIVVLQRILKQLFFELKMLRVYLDYFLSSIKNKSNYE